MRAVNWGFCPLTLTILATTVTCYAQSGSSSVNVGDPAPGFECQDDHGWTWKSSERRSKCYVLAVFFEGSFQKPCNQQLTGYRENVGALAKRGVHVVAISGDTTQTHRLYKELYGLNFVLLADTDGSVARQFDVPFGRCGKARAIKPDGKAFCRADSRRSLIVRRQGTCQRTTFLIDPEGTVIYKRTAADPALDCQQVIAFLDRQEN